MAGRRRGRANPGIHPPQPQQQQQQNECSTRSASFFIILSMLFVIGLFPFITNRLFPDDDDAPAVSIAIPPPSPPLNSSRIAICLFGEGRHFDLTAASILKNLLQEHPNANLHVVASLDPFTYKLLLLKLFPRVIASVNLKYGLTYIQQQRYCLDIVLQREELDGFKYDWIVMTRTDGYWSGPLAADVFVPDRYVVLDNSHPVGGLSEKFSVANRNLMLRMVSKGSDLEVRWYIQKAVPMCVVSDRVAVVSSMWKSGNGEECRPCHGSKCGPFWPDGWEEVFDRAAGELAAGMRRMTWDMKAAHCVQDWKSVLELSENTLDPDPELLCDMIGASEIVF